MAIIETKPAKYKGIEFLMITARTTGGRKDVLFQFPNSDKQTVEDLGLRPRSYSMSAIIPHDNYLTVKDDLLRALEDGKSGALDHPFFGRIENIRARSFTLNERITDLGRAELELTFALDNNLGSPQKAQNAISEVDALNNTLQIAATQDIADNFEVEESFFGNFKDATELVTGAIDSFEDVLSFATAATDKINQYAANINEVSTRINQLVAIPQDLANSIKNIYSTVNGLFASVEATFNAFTNPTFFDFGDKDNDIQQTTQGRTQRAQNRSTFNAAMQVSALGYAYLNAAQVNFLTEEDIDAASALLEKQYLKTLQSGVSSTTLTTLTDLRTITNALLDDKRTQARRIITIKTSKMPMSVLAYQYYGSTELTETLLQLNAIQGASFVEGNIKILTV